MTAFRRRSVQSNNIWPQIWSILHFPLWSAAERYEHRIRLSNGLPKKYKIIESFSSLHDNDAQKYHILYRVAVKDTIKNS